MSGVAHTPSDLRGRENFMPAYGIMLQMTGQIIAEKIGAEGSVLVLGAGGGLELEAFARRAPDWRFCAIDPDTGMLEAAKTRLRDTKAFAQTTWVNGYVDDVSSTRCDAATCLLTLHFVPDDGGKLRTLRGLHARLKPGAPLVAVDLCMDKSASDYEAQLERYRQFALDSGAPADQADTTRQRLRDVIHSVSPTREEALIAEAGFKDAELFYAGHAWRGWAAYA